MLIRIESVGLRQRVSAALHNQMWSGWRGVEDIDLGRCEACGVVRPLRNQATVDPIGLAHSGAVG